MQHCSGGAAPSIDLKAAGLAGLAVLDRDLALALELALEVSAVLVLPVDRSPEMRSSLYIRSSGDTGRLRTHDGREELRATG